MDLKTERIEDIGDVAFHRWGSNTKNDVSVPCVKIGKIFFIYCDCGNVIATHANPIEKVLICDINEEEYNIIQGNILEINAHANYNLISKVYNQKLKKPSLKECNKMKQKRYKPSITNCRHIKKCPHAVLKRRQKKFCNFCDFEPEVPLCTLKTCPLGGVVKND